MKKIISIYLDSFKGLSQAAWLLAVVMLINRMGSMVIPFLGLYMTQVLHFNIKQIGIVLMSYGIGSVCGSYIGGWLTDRIGSFKVQFGSLVLAAPLFLLIPWFKEVQSLSAMIFTLSLIFDAFRPANSVSVASYAKPENITRAFSLNRLAINLGFSIGPAVAGFLATISFDWIFYGNSFAVMSAAIIFFMFFHKRQKRTVVKTNKEILSATDTVQSRNPYTDIPFILFNIFCCIFSFCFFQLITTLPLFYRQVHHLDDHQIGFLLGWSGFVIVLLEMFVVHIAEKRFSLISTLVFGTFLCASSYAMLNYMGGLGWLYFTFLIFGLGEMLTLPFMATVSVNRSTPKTQGAYMGFNSLAFSAANIFSPILGTSIVDSFGFTTLWWATALTLSLTALGFYVVLKWMR
ncbi:MFS transporter [Sphingobacterium thalpophilum]|uniref:MFS transporter n=1 Tax=Sphingobacterium thalpophilum TaxID=259 RepID=A0A4U9W129_9SPHI|nr:MULTISPECIES: MFS transporter [Sphingobacterium]MCW8313230.1 MFS transporter [Sphingobacterium sp. InxBP1]VTR50831.1 multidrug resistance protein MdtH [Sphingobacterium thalpophilum]